ncbi:MAG TPA: GAF domain-containing protein, partial [Chroococcidiopsis sp.]
FEEVEYRMRHKSGGYRWLLSRDCIFSRTETGAPLLSLGVATDITVLKETQLALRESEATNRAMISALPDLVLQIHRDGTYLQIHTSLGLGIRMLRPEQTQIGSHISTILPEKLAEERMTHVHRALSTRNLQVYEYLLPLNDETRYEEARIMPMDDDTALVIVRDITSRKIAEAVLYEQVDHERLLMAIAQRIRQTLDLDQILHTTVNEVRQFLRTDRVIIYRFDPDWSGTIIAESVGEGWNSILGMKVTDTYFSDTRGQAYQQGRINVINNIRTANLSPCHFDFLEQIQVQAKLVVPILQNSQLWGLLVAQHCRSPRQWEMIEIDLQQQLATQIAIAIQQSELYHQVQTLNQELALQVQERTAQLEQALSFEALLKRITDRVRDSLDESQILQAAVEELAQGLQVAACDTGIYNAEQTTSTIAYEFTNTLQPAQGCTFEIADAPHKEVYPYLLKGQACQFCDMSLNPLRSDQRLLTILAVPIVDDQGVLGDLWLFKQPHEAFDQQEVRLVEQVANQCAIALRQSRLYQAAQSQVQELERLNQLKDDFLSTVSHELRSPISSITMVIHMLESSLAPLGVFADPTNPINRYFKVLREESQREADLINDLLDLARLDADTEPLNLTSIALQHYIPHLTEPFIERSRKQQQHFKVHIPAHLPPMTTDLFYLERVLTELFHNASKYTPAGETITVSALSVNDIFEIYVTNSGVEIPPAECDRIFDKFYRIPNNDPWKHGGTGLGLALVKKLIERLGGTIRVESHSQQTTFALQFKGGGWAG